MQKDHQKTSAGASDPHIPVLTDEVLSVLQPAAEESYLDATAGYGGHADKIIGRTGAPQKAVLVDRDETAARHLRSKYKNAGVSVIRSDFKSASADLAEQGRTFDLILADLGLSSAHLDSESRGFAFARNGPLDMRMDESQPLTAEEIVNRWPPKDLERVIREYGEERRARSIARAIAARRPIGDTAQLAKIVADAAGWRASRSRIHPATKTFQAIRIAVNGELSQLSESLPIWEKLLSPGGRLAVISFHSLEDRIVKRFLAEKAGGNYDDTLQLLTKKPITPKNKELAINPRARSAKLRAAVKIKTKKG